MSNSIIVGKIEETLFKAAAFLVDVTGLFRLGAGTRAGSGTVAAPGTASVLSTASSAIRQCGTPGKGCPLMLHFTPGAAFVCSLLAPAFLGSTWVLVSASAPKI